MKERRLRRRIFGEMMLEIMDVENKSYRCMKCEGKPVEEHGRYCPERKKKPLNSSSS